MADQLIDEIISPLAFAQVEKMKAEMQGLTDKFIQAGLGVDALNKALADAKGMGALSNNIAKAQESTTQYVDAGKQLLALQQKIALATSAEGEEIAKLRLQLQLLNESNKDRIKDSKAQEGSITQMRIRLKELQKGYDDMAAAERNAGNGTALLNHIKSVDTELKKLEGGSGRFQRNVGNYSNATFQLSQSLRELPAFAFSAQTGILALSNNLPMLIDEFNKMKLKVDETSGKVLGARGAFLEFGKSIFTFTNIFTIALGLFTIFYKDIMKFVTGTKEADKATKELTQSIGKDIAETKMYIGIIENMNISTEKRILASKKLLEIYPKTLEAYSAEAIAAGKASKAIDQITASIIAYAKVKSIQTEIEQQAAKQFEIETLMIEENHKLFLLYSERDRLSKNKGNGVLIDDAIFAENEQKINDTKVFLNDLKKSSDNLTISMKNLSIRASQLLPDLLDETKDKDGKSKKGTKSKKEAEINRIEELKNQYENERKVVKTHYEQGEIDYKIYQIGLMTIDMKYANMRIEARNQKEKDSLIELNLDLAKNTRESFIGLGELAAASFEKGFKNFKADQAKGISENMVEKAKQDLENFKTYLKTIPKAEISIDSKKLIDWEQFSLDADEFLDYLKSMISAFGDLGMEARMAELYEIDVKENKLNESYKAEQDRINKSYTNKVQKEKELLKLEARKEAQQKQIDRERLQATIKAAKFQKGIDIAELVATTAQAVMAGYKKSGLIGAAMAGALGAVQLATITARPLPQFAKGTEHSPEGYAIVGEKGTELVTEPSGKSWLTPAKDTVAYLKKGSKVTTNEKLMEMVKNSAYVEMANLNMPITTDLYTKVLIEKFEENTNELKALKGIMKDKNMNVQVLGNYDHYLHVRKNIR